MNLDQLEKKLQEINNKRDSITVDIKNLTKQTKEIVSNKKKELIDLEKEAYIKELEIKVIRFEAT